MGTVLIIAITVIVAVSLVWALIALFMPDSKECIEAKEFIKLEKRTIEEGDRKHKEMSEKVKALKRENRQ